MYKLVNVSARTFVQGEKAITLINQRQTTAGMSSVRRAEDNMLEG